MIHRNIELLLTLYVCKYIVYMYMYQSIAMNEDIRVTAKITTRVQQMAMINDDHRRPEVQA